MAAVASQSYFAKHPAPKTPRDPVHHRRINIRFPTYGGVYAWEFERRGGKLNIHVDGTLVFSAPTHMAAVALGGLGIAYLPEVEFAKSRSSSSSLKLSSRHARMRPRNEHG